MAHHRVSARPDFGVLLGSSITKPSALTPGSASSPDLPTPMPAQIGLCRRLGTAPYDLGVPSIAGEAWANPAGDGVGFGNLSFQAADRLVRRFEDLASAPEPPWLRRPASEPGSLQLGLFEER